VRLEVTIDCADPAQLARFWGAALHYTQVAVPAPYAQLVPESGDGVAVVLQRVPEPKTTKNRVHLDLYVDDLDGEVDRLLSLGAVRIEPELVTGQDCTWVVMADPEGNEFCVCHNA
jgi:predicted enzyme related to lactoylglutathione lyase